jgi:hypothetical protein
VGKTKFKVSPNKYERDKVDAEKVRIDRTTGKHGWVWLVTENELRDLRDAINEYLDPVDDRIFS